MNFRREDLAARARFAVELLLSTLAEGRFVPNFVSDYAQSQRREELLDSATRYRELVLMLTRECLLAMSVRLCAGVPRRLFGARGVAANAAETAALDAYREDYFFHLAKVMRWTPEELEEFYNDFEILRIMAARNSAVLSARPKSKPTARKPATRRAEPATPFADRTALLLDPSFMEKARAAAAGFEPLLNAATDKVLAAAFRNLP